MSTLVRWRPNSAALAERLDHEIEKRDVHGRSRVSGRKARVQTDTGQCVRDAVKRAGTDAGGRIHAASSFLGQSIRLRKPALAQPSNQSEHRWQVAFLAMENFNRGHRYA